MNKFFITIMIFLTVSLHAADFGLVVNAGGGFGGTAAEESAFDFQIDLWPRLSFLIGDNGEFIATAGFTVGYENDELFYVPELLHTELSLRFGNSGIRIGRFNYSDPLSFIAEGLFDGFRYFSNTDAGNFHIGAWYTGFLYKKNVNITMTKDDSAIFGTPVDYNDFLNTYFAPRRAFVSIGWGHPSLGEFMNLNTAVIGQFDLSDNDTKFHSQYLVLKAVIPIDNFSIDLGGSLQFSQTIENEDTFNMAFAAEFGFSRLFPSAFNSQLSFSGKIAGGRIDSFFGEFVPITTKYYGFILKHKMSGLSVLNLNYSARLSRTLGASFNASYFVRNDLGTFAGYPTSGENGGYFLGPEVCARFIWSPASDLQINFAGGAFIPALGDAGPNEKIRWRAELTATMAVF